MPKIAKKDAEMISEGLKKFQSILIEASDQDINKSDTIVIVNDILEGIFGFEKYIDITHDYFITSTFCDIALFINKNVSALMEVKAVGIPLKYEHIKNARKYALAKNIPYVILTNGVNWRLYECDPNNNRNNGNGLMIEVNLTELDPEEKADLKKLFTLSKKGLKRSLPKEFKEREGIFNRHIIGALMLSDNFIATLKKELQKLDSNFFYEEEELEYLLRRDILRRDIVESSEMDKAIKRIKDASYTINKRPKSTRPIKSPSRIVGEKVNLDKIG